MVVHIFTPNERYIIIDLNIIHNTCASDLMPIWYYLFPVNYQVWPQKCVIRYIYISLVEITTHYRKTQLLVHNRERLPSNINMRMLLFSTEPSCSGRQHTQAHAHVYNVSPLIVWNNLMSYGFIYIYMLTYLVFYWWGLFYISHLAAYHRLHIVTRTC